jgi:hypothetical protein
MLNLRRSMKESILLNMKDNMMVSELLMEDGRLTEWEMLSKSVQLGICQM